MLPQLAAQPLVEEPDLRQREIASVGQAGIVAADLEQHLAVHGPERVALRARVSVAREALVLAAPHERGPNPQPKKSRVTARQTLRSRSFIFEKRTRGWRVMSAIVAYSFATSCPFFFWSMAISEAPDGS